MTDEKTISLELRRVYRFPKHLVFKAWTDPKLWAQWICPNPKAPVEIENDLRVGGAYRVAMLRNDAPAWTVGGVYQAIDEPNGLSFTWKWENPPDDEESLVTVELRETGDGTELVLRHERFADEESKENHGGSWEVCLNRLEEALASGRTA